MPVWKVDVNGVKFRVTAKYPWNAVKTAMITLRQDVKAEAVEELERVTQITIERVKPS